MKHTAKKIASGKYEYRGYIIQKSGKEWQYVQKKYGTQVVAYKKTKKDCIMHIDLVTVWKDTNRKLSAIK